MIKREVAWSFFIQEKKKTGKEVILLCEFNWSCVFENICVKSKRI